MKKKTWAAAALALLTAAVVICITRYIIVDFHFYPRNAAFLDLRGQDISVSHYETLSAAMPRAEIRWDVPFQDTLLADDTRELTVTSLTEEEAEFLAAHLPQLKLVDGRGCTDYGPLLRLKQLRPDIRVDYWVPIGGVNYASSAIQLNIRSISAEDIPLLPYLPLLKTVTVSGGQPEALEQLRTYCTEKGIAIRLFLGDTQLSPDSRVLEIPGISDEEVGLLYLLPELERVHLPEPQAKAELLIRLKKELAPNTTVTWEKSVLGISFRHNARKIDLTEAIALAPNQKPGDETAYAHSMAYAIQGEPETNPSSVKLLDHRPLPDKTAQTQRLIEEVEAAMAYFPKAGKLILCGSILDNEAMAAFRQRQADNYNVVWTVRCGKVATRTDATFFMPVKYHVYYLNDSEAYNLRYCPDMIAVDIGHMMVSDVAFVKYMPNLRYLILAHTAVRNIEPLRSCKNLKFLELDHTGVLDFSPLQDCTGLEDLNIGNTWNDVEPLKKVTWLKNLWMIFRGKSAVELEQALPDTNIVWAGSATVDSGWRDLPNYFAMRDELKMFYMSW